MQNYDTPLGQLLSYFDSQEQLHWEVEDVTPFCAALEIFIKDGHNPNKSIGLFYSNHQGLFCGAEIAATLDNHKKIV